MKCRKLSHNLVTGATGALLLVTATSCKKNNNPNISNRNYIGQVTSLI